MLGNGDQTVTKAVKAMLSAVGLELCASFAWPKHAGRKHGDAKTLKESQLSRDEDDIDPQQKDITGSEESTAASATEDSSSDTATLPPSPTGSGALSSLLQCPWHDGVAYFLTPGDLCRAISCCTMLCSELTLKDSASGRCLLLVPVVELKIETAEALLDRVSLPHIHILRSWNRLSFNAVASAVARRGPNALRNLDKLLVKGCPLHPGDVNELLAPILASTRSLKLLNLEKNQLGDGVVQQLCNSGALGAERVETLNLRFNKIGDVGAKALASCPAAKTLKWVNLKMNRIGDEGALALARMLQDKSCRMSLLNLRKQFPGLTDVAAIGFAEMLETNNSLQQLRLRRNKIGDRGAVALANVMGARLKRLQREFPWEDLRLELDLEENQVKDDGALSLLRAAAQAPVNARLEVLLAANKATRESLCLRVLDVGEALDALDPRLSFDSKPEFDL